MRTRTRDNREVFNPESVYSKTANGPSECQLTGPFTRHLNFEYKVGKSETTTDVVTPGFHARSAKGEIFNSPYYHIDTYRSVSLTPYSWYAHYDVGYPEESKHCHPGSFSESGTNDVRGLNAAGNATGHMVLPSQSIGLDAMIADAGTQAAANISNPVFAGATFIAEFNETMEFLENPLKAFTKALKQIKRSKNWRQKRLGQTLAELVGELWLAGRYGLRPLVYDIMDALKAISHELDNHVKPKRFTARGSASQNYSNSAAGTMVSYYNYSIETSRTTTVRAGVLYEMKLDRSSFGLRLEDLPIALYEAIRWSFVLDMFVNLGPWIDAITPKVGVRQLASWTSIRHETRTIRQLWQERKTTPSGTILLDGRSTEIYATTETSRTPGTTVALTYRTQLLSGDLPSKLRILDLAAIANQLLGSK